MQNTARRARFAVSDDGKGIVSHAGAVLLTETARVTGLQAGLSQGLERWRLPRSVHDPGKMVTDLAVAVALGGDCLADAAVLRAGPALFGPVASDPVISRLIGRLATDAPAVLSAIGTARAAARPRAWELAGEHAPGADGGPAIVDVDATLVTRTATRSSPRRRGRILCARQIRHSESLLVYGVAPMLERPAVWVKVGMLRGMLRRRSASWST